ncbi:MAG: hypothetical protein ACFCUT_03840 [Kiloniellaceae bacterium]
MQASTGERTPEATNEPNLNLALRRKWLHRLFWLWIGGASLVGSYLVLGGPLTPYTGLEDHHVALVVVPFLLLMLASGLTWLILLVRSRPPRR